MEFGLLAAALTGAGAAWVGLKLWGANLPDDATDKLMASTLLALVVGRLSAMVAQGINPLGNPAEIIVIRGGVSTAAASLAFIIGLAWATRQSPGAVDAVAPAILFGLAGWHAGCVWRGACLGTPSQLPWAWAQEGSLVTRHPVELYAALGLAVAAYAVSRLPWRFWLRAGTALSIAAGMRLITEPMRPSLGDGPVPWYAAGVVAGALIAVVGHVSQRRGAPT